MLPNPGYTEAVKAKQREAYREGTARGSRLHRMPIEVPGKAEQVDVQRCLSQAAQGSPRYSLSHSSAWAGSRAFRQTGRGCGR